VKRSLRTDSYSEAVALISPKLEIVKLLQRCTDPKLLKRLIVLLLDFSVEFKGWFKEKLSGLQVGRESVSSRVVSVSKAAPKKASTPKFSEAWKRFVKWKSWNPKVMAGNQRIFDNLVFCIGDKPVGDISKPMLRNALAVVSKLPQRNKRPYKYMSMPELVKLRVPDRNRVSSKYVKEHLKLCQSLFNRYLVQEVDVLKESPTQSLKFEYEAPRFASLNDTEVRSVISKSKDKPEWFQWFLLLAVYSGARRSEIAGLRRTDIKLCPDTGRYYFVIHDGKTKAARRSVPLHHNVIEAGFLDWIGDSQDALLFPTAHKTPNRVTDLFGSLVDRKTNDEGERIVFHSVRHTFITKARSAGIEVVLVQQVVGHEKTGAGITDRYTHSFQLRQLLPVVDSILF